MASLNDIREDEQYLQFKKVLKIAEGKISLEAILDEAKLIHSSRPSRNLYKTKLEPTAVFNAAANDVNARSRLVEVRAQVYRQRRVIARATTGMRTYLSTSYATAIKSRATTQQERKAVLDRILSKALDMVSEFDDTLEQIDLYIKDIDQTGFAIKNITEVLKLLMAPNSAGKVEV